MKSYVLWGVLTVSGGLLGIMILRNKAALQWLGMLMLQVVFSAVMLYVINLLSPYTRLELPLNAVTVGIVSLLGVPGLATLTALKLWVVG
ncbi:pro-sigmaK processing inhibitor BofA family protein [Paenibacillus puerhi]|uniref:pro-sigmaK processing inhibitor BofA family protein n=1 Tax=Paenibacillus puerhi TaxID=2692622 RepID=UPI0013590214|nr:pro-sigmaK processing inhibitor BofA family protein [Paenibacillus puerhi]